MITGVGSRFRRTYHLTGLERTLAYEGYHYGRRRRCTTRTYDTGNLKAVDAGLRQPDDPLLPIDADARRHSRGIARHGHAERLLGLSPQWGINLTYAV